MFFHLLFPETKIALDPVSTPMVSGELAGSCQGVASVSGQLSVRRGAKRADGDQAPPSDHLEPVRLIFLPTRLSPEINGFRSRNNMLPCHETESWPV
jgi:hypothetical protein